MRSFLKKDPVWPARPAIRDRSSAPAGVHGFALLDVLMASLLLGIVVIGTMQFFSYGQSRIASMGKEHDAYNLARSRMEEVISDGYVDAVGKVETGFTMNGVAATRTTTITFVDDPADSLGAKDINGTQDLKLIRVDVTYGDQAVTLRTLLAPITKGAGNGN